MDRRAFLAACSGFTAFATASHASEPAQDGTQRLVEQLGSRKYAERQVATATLERVGDSALPVLRRAAQENPDPEVRRRADEVVRAITRDHRLVRIVGHHEAAVLGLSLSPGGKSLLSCGMDQTVRLWDVARSREQATFMYGEHDLFGVAFAPAGNRAILGGDCPRCVELPSGKVVQAFPGHDSLVLTVAFSTDGRRVLTGSGDKTIRAWDVATGRVQQRFVGHTEPVSAVAFLPGNRHMASASWDSTIRLWDAATGRQSACLRGHSAKIWAMSIAPNGRLAVSGSDDETARVWDLRTRRELHCFRGHRGRVLSVAFCPQGRRVLSGGDDSLVHLWDANTGKELDRFRGHGGFVICVAFSRDGRFALSGSQDTTLRLWRLP